MIGRLAVREHVTEWVDRAIDVQDGALRSYVAQVRDGVSGGAEGVYEALEGRYLATVSGSGAAVGGAASVPGVGTGLAVGLSVAETVAFLDATALFTIAASEIRGRRVSDLPRRRALLLLALLGDDAVALVPRAVDGTGRPADGWGLRLTQLPDSAIAEINLTAEKWLLTRFGRRQSMYVIGRLAPFGIGAAVGAAGNAITARGVIARVRSAFAGVAPVAPVAIPAQIEAASVADGDTTTAGTTPADVALADATPAGTALSPGVEPPAGKYSGLFTLLEARQEAALDLTLDEIDAAVGGLPAAARRNPGWWTNEPGTRTPQARAWLAAGMQVTTVDLAAGKVHLSRVPSPTEAGTAVTS